MDDIADSSKHSDSPQPGGNQADNRIISLEELVAASIKVMAWVTYEDGSHDFAVGMPELIRLMATLSQTGGTDLQLKAQDADTSVMSKALIQAEIRGAIDTIETMTDALVDEGADNFLEIKHRLISELEKKR